MSEKPIDLVIAETRIKLQEVLNESGLPVTVLAMILREIASMVSQQEMAHIRKLQQIENQSAGKENESV